MPGRPADYRLYLVTDSSEAILGQRKLLDVVKEALEGGVTIVQYREKHMDFKAMVKQAQEISLLCDTYGAKLIVNDRVDVAWRAKANGVHLGQDDMDVKDARLILGKDAIIGVSCSTVEEALKAIEDGADYLGVGAVYATATKENVSGILGVSGVREILSAVGKATKGVANVPCVAIGGLNSKNIKMLMHKTQTVEGRLEGVAVVSAIIGASSPYESAAAMKNIIANVAPWVESSNDHHREYSSQVEQMVQLAGKVARKMIESGPITHNMTNIVVANFAANVAIASGASPIMSGAEEETPDLAAIGGGLVINIGTCTRTTLDPFIAGAQAYNKVGKPVLLDPVGVGATKMRFDIVSTLLDKAYFDIIKGNENEISTICKLTSPRSTFSSTQKGVDSTPSSLGQTEKIELVSQLARTERCIVLMTGAIDYLSDGDRTYTIGNGVSNLSSITGSGCALGALIVAFAAVNKEDKLLGVLGAVLFYEIAAEIAQENELCQGPGHFIPCFLDALRQLNQLCKLGNTDWLLKAKVELVQSSSKA